MCPVSEGSCHRAGKEPATGASVLSGSAGSSVTISCISGVWERTAWIRSQHSRALGRVRMTICAIIRKNMIIRAYSITAVISPICRLPR